ncbi:MAG: 6-oxopurine nucleoside phosphorylase [Archaeoglobaceae archaeon]|nr:6-oxopurine nucleoside phosphorylase [Archaeoglobaceae archaeon]MCX8151969.1 6-oxopurine nucleoside phosphorylase [Archaeoglobaceae archaeon]MDW8013358.1 6-oxopurine nucleoside phosphorylase [Archaeoglobaceae archaeon]
MIGIIGGTHILELKIEDLKELEIETPFGIAEVDLGKIEGFDVAVIRRHGRRKDKPPHKINHAANFTALKSLGVKFAIGMGSVGCLKEDIEIPAIIIPHDYIDFFSGITVFDRELVHITPGFDDYVRKKLIEAAKRNSIFPVIENGIYFQTRGPRLETKAEISMIKNFADCVGMTAGSEATVAKELGIKYAVLCTMDNYAHGIRGVEVDYREIVEKAKKNAEICLKIIKEAIKLIWKENYS